MPLINESAEVRKGESYDTRRERMRLDGKKGGEEGRKTTTETT